MSLVLIGSQPRLVLPLLQAAHALGEGPCLLLGTRATRRLRWSRLCRRQVPADFADAQRTLGQLQALAREQPQAVLVPCDCEAIRLLHRLGPRLPLPTTPLPAPQALELLDNKWSFYRLCQLQGLPVPPTLYLRGKRELHFDELVATLGLPFVVKPVSQSGSLGVVVVRERHDLQARILDDLSYVPGPLIAQRYIDGQDIDVDLLAVDGQLRALTTHRVDGCWMTFLHHPALEDLAARLCRATAYSGPMNLDARIERGSGRVLLLEANPRFWATLAQPAAGGLNFLQESLRAAEPAAAPRRPAGTRANGRHPLLRPREWQHLATGRDPQARLLRAALFDPYALGAFAAGLPGMAWRLLGRAARRLADAVHWPARLRPAQH